MGWAGNGIYYLKLLNPQNTIVTTRKIVLEWLGQNQEN
jgi:hypothetical protein